MKRFFLFSLAIPFMAVTLLSLTGCGLKSPLRIYQVDPLVKVLYCDSVFPTTVDTLRVARGENAVLQLVLSSDVDIDSLSAEETCQALGEAHIGWVHDVYNTNVSAGASDLISTAENYYPDPILDDCEESVKAGGHRTLWVDIDVPRDAKPGLYKGTVSVRGMKTDGKSVKARHRFYVQIYPVTLPEKQQLKVVNWYTHSTFNYLSMDGKGVDPHSDYYYQLLQLIAEKGAEYGQNCWLIGVKPECVLNADSTDIVLDYTCFDRTVETLIEHGNLQTFCAHHIGGRFEGAAWSDGMCFGIYTVVDKKIVYEHVPYDDPRLEPFINTFFGQFEAHLREKGWLDICYQHIADEPDRMGTASQQSWSAVAAMIKRAAPGIRTIDASFEIIDNQDVSVVQLAENIATMPPVPEGSERWMYTCTGPQGNYANRFIQQPLLKTRILHWINYRYNECGYLHYGLNWWSFSKDPLHDATPSTDWPGGDCYIIYPGKEKVYPSIRLSAMRDGIRDYDLLKMAEAIDADKARAWCSSMILGPDSYDMDIHHFRTVRREILEFLSGEGEK